MRLCWPVTGWFNIGTIHRHHQNPVVKYNKPIQSTSLTLSSEFKAKMYGVIVNIRFSTGKLKSDRNLITNTTYNEVKSKEDFIGGSGQMVLGVSRGPQRSTRYH